MSHNPPIETVGAMRRYGEFSSDGREFRIRDPRPPRPWVNLIANERIGLAISQTGAGFSFIDNSQFGVLTNWQQDFATDSTGKFLYLRDADSGEVWSLSPAPVWACTERFACRHGIGYSIFETDRGGIEAAWTLFCAARETIEGWRVELCNRSARPRRIELVAFLEWCCGVAPAPRREFHKLFVETGLRPDANAVVATSNMWDVPSQRYGHWNSSFPYVTAFGCSEQLVDATGDKVAFIGRNGSLCAPAALGETRWRPVFGRHDDPVAALRIVIDLAPGERRSLGFALATGATEREALGLLARGVTPDALAAALDGAVQAWRSRLDGHRVTTPDPRFDALVNDWARYQAISARLWGRAGYYQQSGAFGFRDQLQDSQVWLQISPERCRRQIDLHAGHQFADGSVVHWWHPLTEQGHVTGVTDDLLWLAFVTVSYIKETGDFSVLDDRAPFLDEAAGDTVFEHIERAFARVARRTSARGLPLIGAGDWNDGLSAVGLEERGESVWLGQFLAGLLADWSEVLRHIGRGDAAVDVLARREALVAAINDFGWDGQWYWRATRDDGEMIGSASNRAGRIYLNAQVWAILNQVAPPERARACWAAVREHLLDEAGALLLAPAYEKPVQEIGYITRYAPGQRENGGVYTHAAIWAIAAAARMRDGEVVGRLLAAIDPTNKDPERYWAEPYVLAGNVDGPASPHHCRGGWTWYTGSAAWLHRVVTHWVLGVRPEWNGLRIDPCLPASWPAARMVRPWRGHFLHVDITRHAGAATTVVVDGRRIEDGLMRVGDLAGLEHQIDVTVGYPSPGA